MFSGDNYSRKETNMKKLLFKTVIASLIAGMVAGCAHHISEWDALYNQLSEEPGTFDQSVLEDRRIVIDPGHGGSFRGAVGVDSLTESDANLGVALYLWGMLDEAGADVHLTRSTDRDFLPAGSEELRDDLAARTELANRFEPEVFISIHHNSHISLDRKRNRIEVYYRSSDPSASLELAEDIHIHLARNLGIETSCIKPGNYHVLRNSDAGASILGEASYISHPEVEKRLKISTLQRLEAEAYFLGLLSYFSRGVPIIEHIVSSSDTLFLPGSISFSVKRGAGIAIEPGSMRVTMNGRELGSVWAPVKGILSCPIPAAIPNGQYSFRASVRSTGGARSVSNPVSITVDRPARFFLPMPPRRLSDGMLSLSISILDELGGPVSDGTPVRAASLSGGHISRVRTSGGLISFTCPSSDAHESFRVSSYDKCDTILFALSGATGLTIEIVDASSRRPVDTPLLLLPDGTSRTGDEKGLLELPLSLFEQRMILSAKGYRPHPLTTEDAVKSPVFGLSPVFGGILQGRRVVLDPAGGGDDSYGISPDLVRGSTINLELAKRVKDILESAGARVLMTRKGEETLSIYERIDKVNRFAPHLALGLRFGGPSGQNESKFTFHHYPGSTRGKMAAEHLMNTLAGVPPAAETEVIESASLFLQQTSCPACAVFAPLGSSTEKIFRNPVWLELESSRIAAGLILFFSQGQHPCSPYSIHLTKNGVPVGQAHISVDGVFSATTGVDGNAAFYCLDEGRHFITISLPVGDAPGMLEIDTDSAVDGKISIDID